MLRTLARNSKISVTIEEDFIPIDMKAFRTMFVYSYNIIRIQGSQSKRRFFLIELYLFLMEDVKIYSFFEGDIYLYIATFESHSTNGVKTM